MDRGDDAPGGVGGIWRWLAGFPLPGPPPPPLTMVEKAINYELARQHRSRSREKYIAEIAGKLDVKHAEAERILDAYNNRSGY